MQKHPAVVVKEPEHQFAIEFFDIDPDHMREPREVSYMEQLAKETMFAMENYPTDKIKSN